MYDILGGPPTRAELARYSGDPHLMFGWELVTLADGPGRGVRLLQGRSGAGLGFRVAVDRGFDLVQADFRGLPVGWQSAAGIQNPALHAPELESGLGLLRSFTGLLMTCGLDHFGGPETGGAEHFLYPYKTGTSYALHSRISQIPASLSGYGVAWNEAGDGGVLWCEGVVRQAAVFGEVLELARRIEVAIGGLTITIRDVVTNRGQRPMPHMMLYHYNLGYPLLDASSEFVAPVREIVRCVHGDPGAQKVGYRGMAAPRADFVEQVYELGVAADAGGAVPAALINPGLGLGVAIEFRPRELPVLAEWQCLQAGIYALGIEPCTHHLMTRAESEARGESIRLEAGESRAYTTSVSVLAGNAALEAFRDRVAAIHEPVGDFAAASGRHAELRRPRGAESPGGATPPGPRRAGPTAGPSRSRSPGPASAGPGPE